MKSPKSQGPLKNHQGIPLDYIVIIDSGSKGSRVYVYNWLNPYFAINSGFNLNEFKSFKDFSLVERFDIPNYTARDDTSDDSDDESDDKSFRVRLPKVNGKKKWHRKITPGISTFNNSPQKIGKHHLKHLLSLASEVVPKSQHYRTPIFLHSTAGMRILTPTEQNKVLGAACQYFQSNSDFFLPDCSSHVNVIEGDIEGIYGWLAINYLVGTFDDPKNHEHGKNHTTYGLLDMGGASTQVVFQPNRSEIEEHQNNLYQINLYEVPVVLKDEADSEKDNSKSPTEGDTGDSKVDTSDKTDSKTETSDKTDSSVSKRSLSAPQSVSYSVYSDSFLGLGMSQAYNKYLASLVEDAPQNSGYFYNPPITDPCLPKGYASGTTVNDISHDFTGASDFQQCLNSIFPILSNSTYGSSSQASGNCHQYIEGEKASSCLLNDLIPAFDFDVNHFYGVSGYWYAISKLTQYNDPKLQERGKHSTDSDYDYQVIYNNTQNICSKSYSELIELNKLKPQKQQLSLDELTNLCFKSSWILNFLHLGLGFPRFGIDEVKQDDKFKSLRLVDKVNGSEFSWTLGRALLYANDEYIQAFNNYSIEHGHPDAVQPRAGFTFSPSPGSFHYGGEQNEVGERPYYMEPDPNQVYHYYDYEKYEQTSNELKWYIEPHRWYGIVVFSILLFFIFWLLIGQQGRARFANGVSKRFNNLKDKLNRWRSRKYTQLASQDLELNDLGANDQFTISD